MDAMRTAQLSDVSGDQKQFVYITPGGRPLRLTLFALKILEFHDAGLSDEEIAAQLSRPGKGVLTNDVSQAYAILSKRIAQIEDVAQPPDHFVLRRTILAESAIARIASLLRFSFNPSLLIPGIALAIFAILATVEVDGPHVSIERTNFWAAYGLFVLSLVVHELGHATASIRFGAPVKAIGFAIYLIYPTFYTDVTAAWRLPRHQRVIVDLGGVYFQIFVAAAILVLAHIFRSPTLHAAGMFNVFIFALSLSPFFKSDGFWAMSDALGIANVDAIAKSALRSLLSIGGAVSLEPVAGAVRLFAVYGVASLCVSGFLAVYIIRSLAVAATEFPTSLRRALEDISSRHVPVQPHDAHVVINDVFIGLFISTMVYRLARGWLRPVAT